MSAASDENAAPAARRGPRGLPVLGVARDLRRDPLKYFVDLMLTYGDVVWFRIGPADVVMLNEPDAVRHVLQGNHRNYHKSRFYEAFRPLLGRGIFLAEDDAWLSQRRVAVPSFGGPRFAPMAAAVASAARDLLDRWAASPDGVVDVMPEMMRVTLDAVTRAFFHLDIVGEHDALHDAFTVILRHTERRVWSPLPLPERLDAILHPEYRAAMATLDGVVDRLIDDRRRNPLESDDLLTALIAAHDGHPDGRQLLRDEVVSMIAAGHESTACALAWCLCLLSRHPEAADRLRAEADALGGAEPGFGDLARLPFARMVFDESMRLFPPVWTISRRAIAEDRIGDTVIPAGTTVMLCPYAVHRNPKHWRNPEGFDPARFAPGGEAERARYAWFPFAGGPRVCLGQRFAVMEAQIILTMIAQRFDLELMPGETMAPEPMITLRPRTGTRMRLVARAPQGDS